MKFGLLVVVSMLGCKHHDEPTPTPTDLVVVNPGLPPLRVLHYAIAKGTKTAFELSTDSKVVADTITQTMPTIALTLEVAIDDVSPDGRMKVRTTVVDAAVRTKPDDPPIDNQIAPLKGLAITATLSPDGRITDLALGATDQKLSPAVAEQLALLTTRFQQVAMPLPSVPVGVGAKWRSSRALEQGGMKLTTISTIDVTSLEGGKLAYIMTSELHGPDQTVTLEGVAIDVKEISGTATGHGVIDLATLATAGELTADLRSQMAAQDQPTRMDLSTTITMTPK